MVPGWGDVHSSTNIEPALGKLTMTHRIYQYKQTEDVGSLQRLNICEPKGFSWILHHLKCIS